MMKALALIGWLPFITITGTNCLFPSTKSKFSKIYQAIDPIMQPSMIWIDEPPSEVVFSNWTGKEITCLPQGSPPPEIEWIKDDDQPVEIISGLREYRGPGNLYFPPFAAEKFRIDIHDAIYRCKASTVAGSIVSRPVRVLALYENYTVIMPNTVTLRGNSVKLSCSVIPEYMKPYMVVKSWARNGYNLHRGINKGGKYVFDQQTGDLIVASADDFDAVNYTCTATDIADHQPPRSATGTLTVFAFFPTFQFTFKSSTANVGSNTLLDCVARGNPIPRVWWEFNGKRIYENGSITRYQINNYVDSNGDLNGSLHIHNVQPEDNGLYTCKASNGIGEIRDVGKLHVHGGLTQTMPDGRIKTMAGINMTLYCPYYGQTFKSVKWNHHLKKLPQDMRHQIGDDGSLTVKNVDKNMDSGKYDCIVLDEGGPVFQSEFTVVVEEPPVLQDFKFPSVIQEGGKVQVSCSVVSGDLPIVFSWLKDGETIPFYLNATIRSGEFFSILVFNHLISAHSGNYSCIAKNHVASQDYTATLTVREVPKWIIEPHDVECFYGEDTEVYCSATGYPKPNITWYKSIGPTEYIDIIDVPRATIVSEGKLKLSAVTGEQEGNYLCQAENEVGPGLTKLVHVNVKEPPRFEIPNQNISKKKGDNLDILCYAYGDNPLDVEWAFNNMHMNFRNARFSHITLRGEKQLKSELNINNLLREDTGAYSCNVRNDIGRNEFIVNLLVIERPEPPLDVQVVEISERSMKFAWTEPFDGNSPIKFYFVQYKELGEKWNKSNSINLNMSSITPFDNARVKSELGGLKPGTLYKVRLAALNAIGKSNYSEPYVSRTHYAKPSQSPLNIYVLTLSPTALSVHWSPPPEESWNGDLFGYVIQWKESVVADTTTRMKTVVGMNSNNVTLDHLKKYTTYEIRIAAFNNVGVGVQSITIFGTTAEDVPEMYPENVQCIAKDSRALKVSWEPLAPEWIGGKLLGYKVHYKAEQICHSFDIIYDEELKRTENFETYLNALRPNTNYSIQVLGYTKAGDGVISKKIFCSTIEDVPDPPVKITTNTVSNDSIIVIWLPPETCNGIIIKYNLYYREQGCIGEENPIPIFAKIDALVEYSYIIKNVIALKIYEIWVSATTLIGEGPATPVILQKVELLAPSRIVSFPQHISRAKNSRVILPCKAVGYPKPRTKWMFKNRFVTFSPYYNINDDGDLEIPALDIPMEGYYTCVASNVHEEYFMNFTLTVILPPKAPHVLLEYATKDRIKVTWKEPATNGARVQGYSVSIKDDESSWATIQMSRDRLSYIFYNLKCGTMYDISVTANNRIGKGNPTRLASVRTQGTKPSKPKREDIFIFNQTYVLINLNEWPNGGCTIQHFKIKYKDENATNWKTSEQNMTWYQFRVGNLVPNTTYDFNITAVNEAGLIQTDYKVTTLPSSGNGWFSKKLLGLLITAFAIIVTFLIGTTIAFIIRKHYQSVDVETPKHLCLGVPQCRPVGNGHDRRQNEIPPRPTYVFHHENVNCPAYATEGFSRPTRVSVSAINGIQVNSSSRNYRSPIYGRQASRISTVTPDTFNSIPIFTINSNIDIVDDYDQVESNPNLVTMEMEDTDDEMFDADTHGEYSTSYHRRSRELLEKRMLSSRLHDNSSNTSNALKSSTKLRNIAKPPLIKSLSTGSLDTVLVCSHYQHFIMAITPTTCFPDEQPSTSGLQNAQNAMKMTKVRPRNYSSSDDNSDYEDDHRNSHRGKKEYIV